MNVSIGDLTFSLEVRAKKEGDAGDRGRRGVDDAEDEDEDERNNRRRASVRLGVSGLIGRKTERSILIDGCRWCPTCLLYYVSEGSLILPPAELGFGFSCHTVM